MFHSIACNHCFLNGNKRTAVMALDLFLTANDHMLLLNNQDVYNLSKGTVEANQRGVPLDELMGNISIEIEDHCANFDILTLPATIEKVPRAPEIHLSLIERA